MATLPLPPSGVAFIDPITGGVSIQWQNYLLALSTIGGGFAPIDAEYWVSTPNATLTNETNLGALTTGYLKLTVAAGVGTPSTVASIPGTDITGAALSKSDDTNVTLTLGGTPLTALLRGVSLALGWTGLLGLGRGGTHADLSGTGGTGKVLKQSSVGADVTVDTVAASEIASGAALTTANDTNMSLTAGGTPTTALLKAVSLTLAWIGQLGLARGGSAADLSGTGGTNQLVKQNSAGGAFTVGTIASTTLSDVSAQQTFTPAMAFGGAATGITYTTQIGRYLAFGKYVFLTFNVTLSSKGSATGSATITGFPVTSKNVSAYFPVMALAANSLAVGVTDTPVGYMANNTTTLNLVKGVVAGGLTVIADTDCTNTTAIIGSGWYETE